MEFQVSGSKFKSSIYDLSGHKNDELRKGINIIRSSDGTTKKVLVK
ncbi:MAG: hypothetical protein J5720_02145 [Bacteroidaceae bacterium]|nr:hypothetical protein [Bacteroidaceae bacterium]